MDADTENTDTSRQHSTSKVARVIDEYELTGFGETLEQYWLGVTEKQYSLRQLADLFNCRVLRSALGATGTNPLDGEVENTYRLLTDDEVSAGVRRRTETTLEQQGVDVDQLTQDFVSHQAIHTYLTRYRGVDRPSEIRSSENQVEKGLQTIQRLKSRLQAVTEKNLQTFRNTDRITLGTFNVLVDIRVFCEDCGTQYNVSELFKRNGCECAQRSK